MNRSAYIEDILVQQTTADYLEQQLDWGSIYAYNILFKFIVHSDDKHYIE